jgi:hypothetical protein
MVSTICHTALMAAFWIVTGFIRIKEREKAVLMLTHKKIA